MRRHHITMARSSNHYVPGRAAAPHLIRMLEQVCTISGHRPHQVFEDWVRLCEATLIELPRHAAMMQAEGRLRRPDEGSADTGAVASLSAALVRIQRLRVSG